MSTVLITGASGFIGQALATSMAKNHDVICMSRKDPGLGLPWARGDFSAFEDLRQLDGREIDAVIHLAAVTGGCLERDGILVNVEGTRCLMRYLMDRGCRKFVMASSTATVGFQSVKFRPDALPIPDEHPCYDRDGYGFGKYIMEEITKYHWLQNQDIDVINMRLCSVIPEDVLNREPAGLRPLGQWCLGHITAMLLSDAIRAFSLAALAPHKPGVRILNTTAERVWATTNTADILKNWWGNDVDLSYFRKPGNEFHSVYTVNRIKEELGFTAENTLNYLSSL